MCATRETAIVTSMPTLSKSVGAVVAVLALSVAAYGTAEAGPSAAKITVAKIKKVAKAEIAKAAPKLSVKNSSTVGGKTPAQLKTVVAGAQNSGVIGDLGTTSVPVVTLNYALAAPSAVNFQGVAELGGDGSDADTEAYCSIYNDGDQISITFDVTFDDIGTDAVNPAVNVVLTSASTVAAGAHVAELRCRRDTNGTAVFKDDAAINIVAAPN